MRACNNILSIDRQTMYEHTVIAHLQAWCFAYLSKRLRDTTTMYLMYTGRRVRGSTGMGQGMQDREKREETDSSRKNGSSEVGLQELEGKEERWKIVERAQRGKTTVREKTGPRLRDYFPH